MHEINIIACNIFIILFYNSKKCMFFLFLLERVRFSSFIFIDLKTNARNLLS